MKQTDTITFPNISFSQWEQAVSKLLKEPKSLQDLIYTAAGQIPLKPLYMAEALSDDLAYLADFHAQWLNVFPPRKPEFFVNGHGFGQWSETEMAEAGTYEMAGLVVEGDMGFQSTTFPLFQRFGSAFPSSEFDPLGDAFRLGQWPITGWSSLEAGQVVVHASDIHQAGGTAIQELAYGLMLAARYVQQYGMNLKSITFQLGVGPAFWEELAKMRTMRLLWMNLAHIHKTDPAIATFRAETSTLYWSKTDTDTNLIRHSAEVLSALLGGADQLLVHPHTFESSQSFQAMRLALNLGHLAQKEAHVDEFTDPAHGSFYLEKLTHELSKSAWALFTDWVDVPIEQLLQSEVIVKVVKSNLEQLKQDFESKKRVQIGVNRFPNELSRPSPPFPVFKGRLSPLFAPLDPAFIDA